MALCLRDFLFFALRNMLEEWVYITVLLARTQLWQVVVIQKRLLALDR